MAGAISAPKWSREFEDAIVLADCRKLMTLRTRRPTSPNCQGQNRIS
jgi:hypothetical protein